MDRDRTSASLAHRRLSTALTGLAQPLQYASPALLGALVAGFEKRAMMAVDELGGVVRTGRANFDEAERCIETVATCRHALELLHLLQLQPAPKDERSAAADAPPASEASS